MEDEDGIASYTKNSRRGCALATPNIAKGQTPKHKGQKSLATRKPRTLSAPSVLLLLRIAERRICGSLPQEPPRTTRRVQSPS